MIAFPTDPTCREALATFEVFRRLGFAADDIFFEVAQEPPPSNRPVLLCELRTQGKRFSIAVGVADDATMGRLDAAAQWWNAQTPDCRHCERIFEGSAIRGHSVEVLVALGAKGFTLPVVQTAETAKAAKAATNKSPKKGKAK